MTHKGLHQNRPFRSGLSASSALCVLFGNLPIDPKLTRAFLSFFGQKVHFLFETPRDLGLQGFRMTNLTRV